MRGRVYILLASEGSVETGNNLLTYSSSAEVWYPVDSLPELPILSELIPSRLSFGTLLLVEFDPESLWYETSLMLGASALGLGVRTDYHTFTRTPPEIRKRLGAFGVDVKKMEEEDLLWITDSYSVTTNLALPQRPQEVVTSSVNLGEWSEDERVKILAEFKEVGKRRLHIDDNMGVLLEYNDEKTFVNYWRIRSIPYTRASENFALHGMLAGVASETLYKQLESLSDGILDFRSSENQGELQHFVRLRTLRDKSCDTRWRRLSLDKNGRVSIDTSMHPSHELGIRRWIKGT